MLLRFLVVLFGLFDEFESFLGGEIVVVILEVNKKRREKGKE